MLTYEFRPSGAFADVGIEETFVMTTYNGGLPYRRKFRLLSRDPWSIRAKRIYWHDDLVLAIRRKIKEKRARNSGEKNRGSKSTD